MTMTFTNQTPLAASPLAAPAPSATTPAPSSFVGQQEFTVRPRVRTHEAPQTAATSINLLLASALGLAIILALVIFGGDAAANSPITPVSEDSQITDAIEIYVVQPGDTLWAIASEVARPGEDVRPIVDELKVLTGGSQLEIGQRIIIDHTTIRG